MNEITIHSGETFERVFLNEPNIDLRIVQEADSRVKIHVLNMPFDKSINRYTDMSKQSCFKRLKIILPFRSRALVAQRRSTAWPICVAMTMWRPRRMYSIG